MLDLSIIIVNYNVKYYLEQALISLRKASQGLQVEFFIVDNASNDGSVEYLKQNFPEVEIIANEQNLGFARANNQALLKAQGRYLLIINPDTVVGEEVLATLMNYLDTHMEIGVIGPKVIDGEGKFELGCRRGFPTPFAAFSKIMGLSNLFPNSHLFAKYNLTYLDPDLPCEVDAISGSFMMVRREIYEKVGGFDERFFLYGEDLDWCYRIKQAGWRVFYQPQVKVIHYRGESTLRSNINVRKAFFEAMRLFVKKHYSGKFPIKIAFIRLGILFSYFFDWLKRRARRLKSPLADLILLNLGLELGRFVRMHSVFIPRETLVPNIIYNLGWLSIMSAFGVYGRNKTSLKMVTISTVASLAFLYSFTFFFKQYAFSRLIMLITGIFTLIAVPGWRWLVWKLPQTSGFREWFRRRTLLVGIDQLTTRIANKVFSDRGNPFKIVGFVDCGHQHLGQKFAGVEVLGSVEELSALIERLSIEEVIFSGHSLSYNEILKHISHFQGRVGFKVIPETALDSFNGETPFLELGLNQPTLLTRLKRRKGGN